MQIHGPYNSKDDADVEDLRVNGPANINHHIVVENNTKIHGPCNISGSLECGDFSIHGPLAVKEGEVNAEKIDVHGPLNVRNGVVTGESRIMVHGPLTSVDGTVECDELDIRGPLKVTNESSISAPDVSVHGPLTSDVALSLGDVKISGPLKCRDDFEGQSVKINGPIDIDGSLTATEEIEINLGGGIHRSQTLIDCDYIEAPDIRISGRNAPPFVSGLLDLLRVLLPKLTDARRQEAPFIEVDLKGERIVLRHVDHKGMIEGELTLEEGATHED